MTKDLGKLLQIHFHQTPEEGRLGDLSSAVWQRIHARQASKFSWLYDVACLFTQIKFQVASVSFALAMGMTASMFFASANSPPSSDEAKLMAVKLFTMQAPYLPTTKLGKINL